MEVRVIGIDPGVATTGYAVVERGRGVTRAVGVGVIRTDPALPRAQRLAQLRARLLEVMATGEPSVAAVESFFYSPRVKAAMGVGQASGVALATSAEAGLDVYDYTPAEVKQSVVGVGNASKRQVQSMVAAVLELRDPPQPADAADACALAICHTNRAGLARALEHAGGPRPTGGASP